MMTDSLILDSLEIKNFRTFRHLQIERLGRVNLIVGKNNVGKTSVLEALRLYSRPGNPKIILSILTARDEERPFNASPNPEVRLSIVRHLFYGRPELRDLDDDVIQIGPLTPQNEILYIKVNWYTEKPYERASLPQLRLLEKSEDYNEVPRSIPGLTFEKGKAVTIFRFDQIIGDTKSIKNLSCFFMSANGLDSLDIAGLWDRIALTTFEEDIISSLQIIEPGVERVGLVSDPGNGQQRIPIVKIKNLNAPIPLRSLGESINRMFGLALALVNAKDGLFLIDEIESGLHYTVQPDMWRLIFETARRLNIQVFATTHSWDCIKGFQQAAQENDQVEGILISLRRKQKQKDEIVALVVDERELGIVTQEQIEVR